MQVTLLGTGSAMPAPDRVQTGILVERGDRRLLVDCGAGVLHRLSRTEVGYEGVGTVLLTHHHLDHVADLLALLKARWLSGDDHLAVVGPEGTKALLDDLLGVHDYLRDRVDLQLREIGPEATVEVAGIDVASRSGRHSVPVLAYRFGGPDGPFVFSGDTEAFRGMGRFADGADALVHDCSFPDSVDVSNHPTPTQLGRSLADADVDRLYLSHRYPHTDGVEEEMCDAVRAAGFDGEVRVARDGLRFEV